MVCNSFFINLYALVIFHSNSYTLCLSLSHSISLSFFLSHSLSLTLTLSHSLCLSLSLSLCLPLSLPLSLSSQLLLILRVLSLMIGVNPYPHPLLLLPVLQKHLSQILRRAMYVRHPMRLFSLIILFWAYFFCSIYDLLLCLARNPIFAQVSSF